MQVLSESPNLPLYKKIRKSNPDSSLI